MINRRRRKPEIANVTGTCPLLHCAPQAEVGKPGCVGAQPGFSETAGQGGLGVHPSTMSRNRTPVNRFGPTMKAPKMTTRHEVTCIIPHAQHEGRIHSIGGPDGGGWTMLEDSAISGLLNGAFTLYTATGGIVAEVKVHERDGRRFLQTVADGVPTNNLSRLPRCPATYKQVN